MANIIPIILILVSLLIILIIVIRKFSILASLDVETIPAEKEARFKEQLVESRLNRNIAKITSRLTWIFRVIGEKLSKSFSLLNDKLHETKKNYGSHQIEALNKDEKKDAIGSMFSSLEDMDDKEDFAEMEEKLIEIIGLDSKSFKAFESLGALYYKNKKYEEAKQAFEHALKLLKDDETDKQAEIYFDLALMYRDMDNMEEAVVNINKSVKFSPNNPRFLDSMLEISIIVKDREMAKEAFERLIVVNPENNKLQEWENKIKEI